MEEMATPEADIGLPLATFLEAVTHGLRKQLDNDQLECVTTPADESLFIVAGPGSGKTTALTLRILRLIFVDLYDPHTILATTFTNRAAAELRSRILGWGSTLRAYLAAEDLSPPALDDLDLNRIQTGTLDSICEQALRAFRPAGQAPPVVLEQFQADALMTHRGLFPDGRFRSQSLEALYKMLKSTNRWIDFTELRAFSSAIRDRMVHDQIDVQALEAAEAASWRGVTRLAALLSDYTAALEEELALDYAGLEERFLAALRDGELDEFANPLRAIFVDEYQDTNYVQELIYFALVQQGVHHHSTLSVVGDDDQALYRFRGATVELFQDYEQRLEEATDIQPHVVYLSSNYRSARQIVEFYDAYVKLDRTYATSRGNKPDLRARRDPATYDDIHVLGLFRPTIGDVADALADFLDQTINGNGFPVPGTQHVVRRHTDGSAADCALLCSSPQESAYNGNPRLPALLRDRLQQLATPIAVFNPRGTAFHAIPEVAILGGLLLECLDPGAAIQDSMTTLPTEVSGRLTEWRSAALSYVQTDPEPHRPRRLSEFVQDWQRRRASDGAAWPREVPIAELLYKLATWVPQLISDVEGLVYLETFGRTIVGASRIVEPVVLSDPQWADSRVTRLIREVFGPLAIGGIELDEELFETLPGDRLGLLSIHQSKGLEFPLVIVDIGCHFPDNRPGAATRFPRTPSAAANLEDFLRPYSDIGIPARSALDRTFDDLVRQYFVAFSRAKEVLVLAGIGDPDEDGPLRRVKNVAAGWTRNDALGSRWSDLPAPIYI